MALPETFHRLARRASDASGSTWMFLGSLGACVGWLALGPLCGWGPQWNLWPTAILTWTTWLVMVLVKHDQETDSRALHVKLDELLRVTDARNALVGLEQQPLVTIAARQAEVREQARDAADSMEAAP